MQNTKSWFNVNIYIKPSPRHVAYRLVLSSPTSHQLLGDDSNSHQTGDVIPPVCPRSDPGVTSWLDMDNEARCIYTWARFNFHARQFFSSREVWLRGADSHNSRLTLGCRRTWSSAENERKSTLAVFDSTFYWLRGHSIGHCCQTTLRCTKKRQKRGGRKV